jgi:hypothetical protein
MFQKLFRKLRRVRRPAQKSKWPRRTYLECEALELRNLPSGPGGVGPTAVNATYSFPHNQSLSVAVPGILANDSDPFGRSLSAVLESGVQDGSLTLNSNGSFTYAPTN